MLSIAALLFLISIAMGFIYLQNLLSFPRTARLKFESSFGYADAQYELGILYYFGTAATPRDFPQALELFTQAAKQNHPKALVELGVLNFKGKEIPKDEKKAFEYFEKAASLKDAMGIFNLGVMYQFGYGTDQNIEKAYSLYEQSENMGYSDASVKLGEMNYKGIGRKVDFKKAFNHFLNGAKKGNAAAQYWVGWYYEDGLDDINTDYKAAFEWYKKSADQNYPEGIYKLGEFYFWGHGVDQDYLKSGEYFAVASSKNITDASSFINTSKKACLKEIGSNIRIYDYPMCFIAAASRDPAAMDAVGNAYLNGRMKLDKDHKKAFSWYLPCAELGYAPCQMQLAKLYHQGEDIEKNNIEAYAWMDTALKGNHLNEAERQNSVIILDWINQDMTEEEKIKAEKRAKEYEQLYSNIPE